MTRRRLEILQWYGLFGGALAWTTQHVVGYFASQAGCTHAGLHPTVWQVALGLGAGAAVLAAEAAAYAVYRATSNVEGDAAGPAVRLRFFATAALLGNALFLMIVILDAVGSVAELPCRGS
jgi:hypothetical protein